MNIEVIKLKNKMKISLSDLITRPLGKKFYNNVIKMLENAANNEVVQIDFDGISTADISFLDEFIIKIIRDSIDSPKVYYIKLKNFSDATSLNLETALASYFKDEKERLAVVSDKLVHNDKFCLGFVSEIEKKVLNYLNINKSASISNISDYLELNVEEVKKVLDSLYKMRLIKRDEFNNNNYFGV